MRRLLCAVLYLAVITAMFPIYAAAGGLNQNATMVSIPDGTYEMRYSGNLQYAIEIKGGSTDLEAITQLYRSNSTDAQRFEFTRQSNGAYVITNKKSGYALEVKGWSKVNNGVIQQYYNLSGHANQQWYIERTSDGYYSIRNAYSSLYVDLHSGTVANGTQITQYAGNGTGAQKFALEPVSVSIDSSANAGMVSVAGCSSEVYTGKPRTPSLSVACGAIKLAAGKDYSVSYSNNVNIGMATVSGKGAYTGRVARAFAIVPGRARLSSAKGLKPARGTGVLQARWRAAAGAGGYEVQVSTSKGFSGKSTKSRRFAASSKAGKRRSFKGAGLKRGRRYYVRVRAYKKAGRATCYGAWSPAKSAKTRKR